MSFLTFSTKCGRSVMVFYIKETQNATTVALMHKITMNRSIQLIFKTSQTFLFFFSSSFVFLCVVSTNYNYSALRLRSLYLQVQIIIRNDVLFIVCWLYFMINKLMKLHYNFFLFLLSRIFFSAPTRPPAFFSWIGGWDWCEVGSLEFWEEFEIVLIFLIFFNISKIQFF